MLGTRKLLSLTDTYIFACQTLCHPSKLAPEAGYDSAITFRSERMTESDRNEQENGEKHFADETGHAAHDQAYEAATQQAIEVGAGGESAEPEATGHVDELPDEDQQPAAYPEAEAERAAETIEEPIPAPEELNPAGIEEPEDLDFFDTGAASEDTAFDTGIARTEQEADFSMQIHPDAESVDTFDDQDAVKDETDDSDLEPAEESQITFGLGELDITEPFPAGRKDESASPGTGELPGIAPSATGNINTGKTDAAYSSPAEEKPRGRTGVAVFFGLLAIAVAAVAVWMNFNLSRQVSRLETKVANTQPAPVPPPDQTREIADINHRLDALAKSVQAQSEAAARTPAPPPVINPETPAVVVSPPPARDEADTVSEPAASPQTGPPAKKPEAGHDAQPAAVKPEPGSVSNAAAPWFINITSLSNRAEADRELASFERQGLKAEIIQVDVLGKKWSRIRLPGFKNAGEARKQLKVLQDKLGLQDMWISKR